MDGKELTDSDKETIYRAVNNFHRRNVMLIDHIGKIARGEFQLPNEEPPVKTLIDFNPPWEPDAEIGIPVPFGYCLLIQTQNCLGIEFFSIDELSRGIFGAPKHHPLLPPPYENDVWALMEHNTPPRPDKPIARLTLRKDKRLKIPNIDSLGFIKSVGVDGGAMLLRLVIFGIDRFFEYLTYIARCLKVGIVPTDNDSKELIVLALYSESNQTLIPKPIIERYLTIDPRASEMDKENARRKFENSILDSHKDGFQLLGIDPDDQYNAVENIRLRRIAYRYMNHAMRHPNTIEGIRKSLQTQPTTPANTTIETEYGENESEVASEKKTTKSIEKTERQTPAEGEFDVFLSHNSKDKALVRAVAEALKAKGIRSWFDEAQLIPGESWIRALQKIMPNIPCAAVFFGPEGIGPWEQEEMEAFLVDFVSKGVPVIPVILPNAPEDPELPPFLRTKTWVNMRDWENDEDDSFYRLVCGIIGKAPGDSPKRKFDHNDVAEWRKQKNHK